MFKNLIPPSLFLNSYLLKRKELWGTFLLNKFIYSTFIYSVKRKMNCDAEENKLSKTTKQFYHGWEIWDILFTLHGTKIWKA